MKIHHTQKVLLIIFGILAAVSLVYISMHPLNTKNKKFSSQNVVVTKADISSSNKLPSGFPTNTPIELANIIDANTLSYPDKHVEVTNVSYFSLKQQEELFSIYGSYLKANGYTVASSNKNPAMMTYVGKKGNTELDISISPQQQRMLVLISQVIRQ
ncbi:MAG: hypothetical protein JWL80_27 [Parcubacteria group bacterium]|nr:hypothetical protein [Parcubacteria group bacterium]